MDMQITVTHTLSPEVLQVLNKFLNGSGASLNGTKEAAVVEMKQKAAPAPAENAGPGEVKIEEIRAKVQEKQKEGKRELIKALLSEFGSDKVTSLPPDQYSAFMQKLIAV